MTPDARNPHKPLATSIWGRLARDLGRARLATPAASPRTFLARRSIRALLRAAPNRSRGWRAAAAFMAVAYYLMASNPVSAHSASDAYLTLTAAGAGKVTLRGQWDIALRDLDFVLKLDDDGDGRLTWGEVRHHQPAIEHYAFQYLKLDGGPGNVCTIKPGRQMIDDHADGAYEALFFDAVCAHAPRKLTLRYTLFFAIDPSHRGIFVMHSDNNIATALLSPENAKVDLNF